MVNKGQLWHEKLTYDQICSAGEEDADGVIYNLHEDCLCLVEDNAALTKQLADLKAVLQKVRVQCFQDGARWMLLLGKK